MCVIAGTPSAHPGGSPSEKPETHLVVLSSASFGRAVRRGRTRCIELSGEADSSVTLDDSTCGSRKLHPRVVSTLQEVITVSNSVRAASLADRGSYTSAADLAY